MVGVVMAAEKPQWIWNAEKAKDGERVFFRRSFELPEKAKRAVITATCDNGFTLYLNGKSIARGADWSNPQNVDVRAFLQKGRNVFAVAGTNEGPMAGLCVQFEADAGGEKVVLSTDGKWVFSTKEEKDWMKAGYDDQNWKPVKVLGPMGMDPWGNLFNAVVASGPQSPQDATEQFKVAKGFKLEKLYDVPKTQGSWVSMTQAPDGRLVVCDQYGGLYRVTVGETVTAEPWDLPIGGSHGMLWFKGALYISVNETPKDKSKQVDKGVYKVVDSNGDGELDKLTLIKKINGGGEHGLHSLVASPDGEWLYFIAGNHTKLPEIDHSWVPQNWKEDHLLPRNPDGRGHARGIMAPGGYICRFKPDGSQWELMSSGYRNPYDMAFNVDGDLFAYDADMEWDLGMPWFRPTRLCHAVPGSEFGWRNGTGKWPTHYEDSLPPVFDISPGSPTGAVSGKGAKFPKKYQEAIYLLDWTYATIHAVTLEKDGASYTASREDFVAGAGLPLTDAIIGQDGAMYFATGGRRTAGALWRVTYVGEESTAEVKYSAKSQEVPTMDESVLQRNLASDDRFIRTMARVQLEREGADKIRNVLQGRNEPQGVITECIGLARTGGEDDRSLIVSKLERLGWEGLPKQQKLGMLRAYALTFSRLGEPSEGEREKALGQIDAAFPAKDDQLNAELCRLLCYLQAPKVVERTLKLMKISAHSELPDWAELATRNKAYGGSVIKMLRNMPPGRNIHYAYCLRVVKGPWTEGQRKQLFEWFAGVKSKSGGNSYQLFLEQMQKDILATATEEERKMITGWKLGAPIDPFANLPAVKGPGKNWTVAEVTALAAGDLSKSDLENGKKMFKAALCAACHRIAGDGGSAGPDLTAVSGRFAPQDLADALIDPSKTVSDQYNFELITKKDGSVVMGKTLTEKDDILIVATNAYDFTDTTEVPRSEIKLVEASEVSPMPPGLINRLNEEELKDLLGYLMKK